MQNCSKLFTWKYSEKALKKLALNSIKHDEESTPENGQALLYEDLTEHAVK